MSRKQQLVSVIIPTYNRADLLRRSIRSVLAQTYDYFELIVVDDASEDETAKVVSGFADRRIRYLTQAQNLGVSAARNRGISEAAGEFIAFLDSDDEWLPTKLKEQILIFDKLGADFGLVYCGSRTITSSGARINNPKFRGDISREILIRNVITGSASSAVIRRDVARRIGFFDEQIPAMEDYDYWIRVARSYLVDFVNKPLACYYDLDSSERRSRNRSADIRSREIIYRKNRNFLRLERLSCRFHLISARRRLNWITPPDKKGAILLILRAWQAAPLNSAPYYELIRQLVPARTRETLKLLLHLIGRVIPPRTSGPQK